VESWRTAARSPINARPCNRCSTVSTNASDPAHMLSSRAQSTAGLLPRMDNRVMLISRLGTALLIAGAIALTVPPFFTRGACTSEFDAASDAVQRMRPEIGTVTLLRSYLEAHSISYQVVQPERCASSPIRDLVTCPDGPTFVVTVPVKNTICRYYRDDNIRIHFGFNNSRQLTRIETDMKPFKYLTLPLGQEVDWAR